METVLEQFRQFFTSQLNPEQQKAVAPSHGILLVCAGAGSGKTRVITARMAQLLLEHNVTPHAIVALTFTNKAAREMKERIISYAGKDSALPYVGTFHAYCLRLLKQNAHLHPLKNFSLLDDSDQDKLMKKILHKHHLKGNTSRQYLSTISHIKNGAISENKEWSDPQTQEIYNLYEQEKKAAHCLDFDDLLVDTLTLFKTHPTFKEQFQNNVRHVLVDEYQDTNHIQHELLCQMTLNKKKFALDSLCVVGDEDQSIYSWRGATVRNILDFKDDFPDALSITIEQNYRSVQPILSAANTLISHNTDRNPKKLWSEKEGKDRIRVLACASNYQEAESAALFFKQVAKPLKNYAILYRSHYQSRALEEALIHEGIPYKIIGGVQFYERQEIKDLLGYLTMLVNPYDRIACSRIINCPPRGLGEKFEEFLFDQWNQNPLSTFIELAHLIKDSSELTHGKKQSLNQLVTLLIDAAQAQPTQALELILTRTNYFSYLNESYDADEARARKENIKELQYAVKLFEEKKSGTLADFLHEVSLLQELNTRNEDHDYVSLMTLHAAKGLEFNTVLITGIEEGVLPSSHSLYKPENLEEERRLFYVGMTRARERLLLMHARHRAFYGSVTDQRPSRFLQELPNEHLARHELTHQLHDLPAYFALWISGAGSIKTVAAKQTPTKNPVAHAQKELERILAASPFGKNKKWQYKQKISHQKFGIGIIEQIDERDIRKTILTIRFDTGTKKIDSKFIDTL